MRASWNRFETKAGRALRALAEAGFEITLFIVFLLSVLFALLLFDRWVAPLPLLSTEIQMQTTYAVHDSLRAERIITHYKKVTPEGSEVNLSEQTIDVAGRQQQQYVINIVLKNLNGPAQLWTLPDYLWQVEENSRSLQYEVVKLTGPPPLVAMLLLHFLLIPWLFLRYRFLPADSPPARPLFLAEMRRPRFILGCLSGGIALGFMLSLLFIIGMHSGVLTFSRDMPSHESLGMTTLPLIFMGALALGLGGFLEEAFLRGVVLRRFFQNGVPVFGIVVCAFWFAALHAFPLTMQSGDVAFIVSAFGAGLGFGWITLRFRSWLPAGLVHAGYNFSVTFASLAAP